MDLFTFGILWFQKNGDCKDDESRLDVDSSWFSACMEMGETGLGSDEFRHFVGEREPRPGAPRGRFCFFIEIGELGRFGVPVTRRDPGSP